MGTKNQTSSGTSNGTSTTTFSPQVQTAYNALLGNIGGTSSGTNAATTGATAGLTSLAANSNPAYASASNTLSSAATPAYASISQYLSPYLSSALAAQEAVQNNQNAQQQQGVVGNAAAEGALGGNRVGVAQAQLAGQQALANNQANSSLINSAYQQAENAALSGQQNETAAGTAQAGLGSSQTASSLSTLLGELEGGNSQFGNLASLAGAASGLSQSGATTTSSGTTSATVPNGNLISQILGGLTSIAGLLPGGTLSRGGVVPRYDAGGVAGDQSMERAAAAEAAQAGSANVIQSLQQYLQQSQQQPQFTAEQKQGATNIRNWLTPQPAGLMGEMSGAGSSYRTGGVVPRHYDGGGYVYPDGLDLGLSPSVGVDYSALLDQITNDNDVPAANDNGSSPATSPMPMAVNAGVVPASAIASAPVTAGAPPGGVPVMRAQPSPSVVPPVPMPRPADAPSGPTFVPASPSVVPASSPLTVRTNNPGAIMDGPWARQQPGYFGNDGGFAVFNSPAAGQAAHVSLLGNYLADGQNTLAEIINRWAPQSANAPGSTAAYVNYVAQRTGIAPNAPVSRDALPAIAAAQSEWESGLKPGMDAPLAFVGGSNTPAVSAAAAEAAGAAHGVVPAQSWQDTLAADAGFGRPVGPNPENGPQIADNGVGFNPSRQNSPNIGSVVSSLLAGNGTGLSDPMRAALISAGLGMMSGTNGNALVNIGSGAQQGFGTYNDLQAQNRDNAATQANIEQQAAEAQRAKVAAANEGTTITPAGIGAIVKQVDPTTGAVTYGRLPYSSIPVIGQSGPAAAATPAPPGTGMAGAPANAGVDANGFTIAAPDMTSNLPMLANTDAGAAQLQQQGRLITDPAIQQAVNSRSADVSLAQMADLAASLPANGILTQGAGFNERVGIVNAANTALQALGMQPIDPNSVATAEDLKKLATQLQFAVADQVKADPAASTIVQAAGASPSGENTIQGFRRIIGNLQAVNKRSEDRAAFLQSWQNQNMGIMSTSDGTTADDVFNKLNPPSKYIDYGQKLATAIVPKTQADIDRAPKGTVFNIDGTLMVK